MSEQDPQVPYSGTTGERLRAFALSDDARDRISTAAARYWELSAYALIAVLAAALRFWHLGNRAMHHDESLHGFFAYGFTKSVKDLVTFAGPSDTYKHVPFMHGPFQFIGNGFMMAIVNDGEYQARMLAATMGTGMVVLPFLFRKQLGTIGALAAAAFIAISPTLLYYSRFTREDIYTGFWTFGLVVFMWRYIATKQERFLFLTAAFMAFSFCTKETTFMTVGAFLVFLDYMLAGHIAEKIRAKSPMSEITFVGLYLALMLVAWAIALAWPFIEGWRAKYELDEMPAEASLMIVMGTLAAPMYSAAVQLVPISFFKDWRDRAGANGSSHIATQEFKLALTTIIIMIGASSALGLMWKPRTWLIAAACFWVPFILLYTTFFANPPGFLSGMWGSMDYWLSQQNERRGNQPDYYYFVTTPVYEFLPLLLAAAAGAYYAIRGRVQNALVIGGAAAFILLLLILPAHALDDRVFGIWPLSKLVTDGSLMKLGVLHYWIPFSIALLGIFSFKMDVLNRFLLFWAVITAFALTVAGEKMPWLNVHIALPLAVVAGRFLGEMVEHSDLRPDLPKLERLAPFLYAAVASALCILVFVIVGPFAPASAGGWLLAVVAAVAVYWAYSGYSRKTAMQVALVGACAALSVFSLRAAILASFGHPDLSPTILDTIARKDHGDVPVELLVYTQTSGDIPILQSKIDQYAKESGQGENTAIVVDSTDGYTWPWAWYLRHYKKVTWVTVTAGYTPPSPNAILLISKSNASNVQLGGNYSEGTTYHHRRWFPEDYRGIDGKYSTRDFFSDLFTTADLRHWLDYWVRRTPPSQLGTVDGVAFFPKGFADIPHAPVGPTVKTEGTQMVIGSPGSAPGQLAQPADVAFDAQGNIYVADTNNNRIQKYDAQGKFVALAGGFTSPDVTMTQPWSMTVAADGTVFVADTWDHKIIKLDSDLKKVKEWGGGGQVDAGGDPKKLFGPREIVLNAAGNLLVSDTGNNRIIEYTQDGDVVRQFGAKGSSGGALEFQEPVSIVTDASGDMWIADFWNKRIVHLDKDLKLKGQISIATWGSTAVTDRPYLALLPDGRLLATDPDPCTAAPNCPTPQDGKILIFNADGSAAGSYDVPKESGSALVRPTGLATDGTSVLVSDSAAAVVRKIALSEIVK
jgi:uncharacterized protein (TIGR03663 family)